MSKFSEWLYENDYTSSDNEETCQDELSAVELDVLHDIFTNI